MARRQRQNEEIAFGSDSFLDILANIVGILIILIVVAGMRMSQTPVMLPDTAPEEVTEVAVAAAPVVSEPEAQEPPAELLPSTSLPTRAAAPPEPIEQPPIPEPPPLSSMLVTQVATLEQNNGQLKKRNTLLAAEEKSLTERRQVLRKQLEESTEETAAMRERLAEDQHTAAAQEQLLNAKQRNLANLQMTLAEIETERAPTKILKHELNPIGRKVDGNEIYLLLAGGRVAVVPLKEMLEERNASLERKRDQILRTKRYVGSIGPVQGFHMEYVVQRIPASLVSDPQQGIALFRAAVTEYQIDPDVGVHWEDASQALNRNSRFLDALQRGGYGATVLAWVYPDSFDLYRDLQEFAHEQRFAVAASPLPDGVPLGISSFGPRWSRTVAQ